MNEQIDIEYKELDIYELAQHIFTQSYKSPFSFNISFDTESIKTCFETLLIFFTEGLKIKYGVEDENGEKKVDLESLTEENLFYMKHYMFSVGMDFILEVKELPILPKMYIQQKTDELEGSPSFKKEVKMECIGLKVKEKPKQEEKKESIQDYRFNIHKDNKLYIISFDYCPRSIS